MARLGQRLRVNRRRGVLLLLKFMTTQLARFVLGLEFGFLTEETLPQLIAMDRLCPCLVRLGAGRFTAPAQDVDALIGYAEKAGDYVRDVSIVASVLEEARSALKAHAPAPPIPPAPPCAHFNEAECGGVFDGNRVWSDTEIDGAPGF